jgi:hypothetical protein
MARQSFIQVKQPNGKRKTKLIPIEEYHGNNVRGPSTHVMPDIKPFQSPVTGEMITTRPQLREHNRVNGVTNSADYGPNFEYTKKRRKEIELQQKREGKAHRTELLINATDKYRHRR